jgi:hypothetical protein
MIVIDDSQTLTELQHRWMEAWRRRDRDTLELILAHDFALTVSTDPAKPIARADWLRLALGPYRCDSFTYQSMTVRVLGSLAIVASRYRQQASVGDADRSGEFFLTDVWRRTEASWQVVARYSSFPEPPGASGRALT